MFKETVLKSLNDPRFLSLYFSSFPRDELIPPFKLARLLGNGGKLRIYTDGDVFVGFCFTFEWGDAMYVAYLAVVPELRREGYGSDILQQVVSERKHRGYILTAERVQGEGVELRQRYDRRRFYRRNGWKQSYTRLLTKGVDMDVYELDSTLSEDEILDTIRAFYNILG